MALTPAELAALGRLGVQFQQAQARLEYLRASAKLAGVLTGGTKREITAATTARDRLRREITASQSGTTYQAKRQARRNYAREAEVRRERKRKLSTGEALPRPLTSPEYQVIQHYKGLYQFLTEDFRNKPNNRETYRLIKRTGDTLATGTKPGKKLEKDYERYTGQPFPWESWRLAYIATKIVPWNPPDGFEDEEAA